MEEIDKIVVRVKYQNEFRFFILPLNDLKSSTFAYRGKYFE